ncbi:hypothetical protein [Streptomyces sp. XY413]|uniref:hypothetical protein n=1 Tax=Streptomyces sp. XY413 TaxID=1519479 RepID=UPI000B13C5AD|nr:hypothetical protein [Streptomyces sp. XY413]
MNDEDVITVEIRGHEPAAVAAAQRISDLWCTRTSRRKPDEGGYLDREDKAEAQARFCSEPAPPAEMR